MKRRFVLVWLFTAALGSGLHFLYDALPIPLVGLFAPVSESVWEHMKLLFWPFLVGAALLSGSAGERDRFWSAAFAAQLLMPPVLAGAHYLLRCGFGVQSVAADIALYAAALAGGVWLLHRGARGRFPGRALGVLLLLCALYAACLVLFSIAAPPLPIFQSAA